MCAVGAALSPISTEGEAALASGSGRPWRRGLVAALQVIGLVLLLGLWIRQADTSGIGALATPRAAGWLGLALVFYWVGQLLNGFAWRHLLQRAGGQVTLSEMVLHDLSSVFWCSVLPGGVAGELVKGLRLARGADPGTVAVSLLCARLVGGTVACGLALACLPASGFEGPLLGLGAAALSLTAGVGLGGLLALALGPSALPARLAARLPIGRFPAAASLLVAFALALVTHSVFALVYSACFAAAGLWMPFAAAAVVSALTSVAQLIPLTVGGMGIRELSISALAAVVVARPVADAGAVALAGVFTVFIALGGLVELGRALSRRR